MKKKSVERKKMLRYRNSKFGISPKMIGPINICSHTMRFCKKQRRSSYAFKNYRNRGIISKEYNKYLINKNGIAFWVLKRFKRQL